jgi:hypothetical protein
MAEPTRPQFQSYQRKKRRRIAWIVFGISGTGVAILTIIAFIGQISGNFTIKLNQEEAHLGLSADDGFTNQTTYLTAAGLPNGYQWSADDLPDSEVADSNTGGDKSADIKDETGKVLYQKYFGMTFFMKNFAPQTAAFHVSLNIDDYTTPSNQATSLLESLRVRVYENIFTGTTETHNCETYALTAAQKNWFTLADGTTETRECIGKKVTADDGTRTPAAKKDINNGFATNFESNQTVFGRDYNTMKSEMILRYSVQMWIEGDDPEAQGIQPIGSSITLSMHFSSI